MEPTDDDFWIKVARSVNLTDKEARSFLDHQSDDPEREKVLAEVRQLWEQSQNPSEAYQPDVERGWQRLQFLRRSEENHYRSVSVDKSRSVYYWQFVRVAASVVLAMGISYVLWQQWAGPKEVRLTTTDQKQMFYLPDSSRVWLNRNSELMYNTGFDQDNRVVYLAGEAFFEVRKAEGRRFAVYSGLAKTEVIGTSFNLNAYSDDSVVVQVVSGRVAFSPRDEDNAIFLSPGQRGLLLAEQKTAKRALVVDPNFRTWQNNQLLFDNTRLTKIIQLLEQQYGVTVELADPDLANCRYTASFNNASLDEILEVLSEIGDLKYSEVGDRVILSGTGCP